MGKRRASKGGGALAGGDALTWALILGVGGFAVFKGVQELRERQPAAGPTGAAPTTGTVPATGGGTVVGGTPAPAPAPTPAPVPAPAPTPAPAAGGQMWAGGTPPWVFDESNPPRPVPPVLPGALWPWAWAQKQTPGHTMPVERPLPAGGLTVQALASRVVL